MSDYSSEEANRDRRALDAALAPVVDALCAKRGVTRADILTGALVSPDRQHQDTGRGEEEERERKREQAA